MLRFNIVRSAASWLFSPLQHTKIKNYSVAGMAGGRFKINERIENLSGARDEGKQGDKFSF